MRLTSRERKQQVDAIHTAENALNLFYAKSKAVRDFYRRYPDREVVDLASSYARRVGTEHGECAGRGACG